MKYARLDVNFVIIETFIPQPGFTLEDSFVPEIAAQFVVVPEDAENGDTWKDGVLTKPPAPEPEPPAPRTWVAADFHAQMTLSEKVKWDNNQSPEIVTAKKEMITPQQEAYTTEILDMLVASGDISVSTKNKILA